MMSRAHAALVASGVVMFGILLYAGRWMTFWWDEWTFIATRPDAGTVLAPYFDTFIAVPALVYHGLLAVFGLSTYLPYLLVAWAAHFAIAALVYRVVRRRSGELLGCVAGVSVVFLGTGFEVLLQPFQIQYLFAIVGGLAAIDGLERGRRLLPAVALVVAVASSGLGVIYTGLVLLWGLLRRHRPTVLAALPAIAVYTGWYFTWGRESGRLPGPGLGPLEAAYSILHGMGAAVAGITGLPPPRFALVGLGLAVIAVAILLWRGYRPYALTYAAVAALVAEQVLRVAFRGQFGTEYGARSGYVYAGVIFLWLAIAGFVDHLPSQRAVPLVAGLLLLVVVVGNMRQFAAVATLFRGYRATQMAELRLMESLRGDPRLALDVQPDDKHAIELTARRYFATIDRFGAPALGYDYAPFVDGAAVEAARARLLP